MSWARRYLSALALAGMASGCTAPGANVPATGELAGRPIQTRVDTVTAAQHLGGDEVCPAITGPGDRDGLAALASRRSPDTAAICFARAVMAETRNRTLQRRYLRSLAGAAARPDAEGLACPGCLFLFVPGFHYHGSPTTGADLGKPRERLATLGLEVDFIEIDETGPVHANAQHIARRLRALKTGSPRVFLVSASKGGADVAEALGGILTPAETLHVEAWINIGGTLGGTRLAEMAGTWPVRPLTTVLGWLEGYRMAAIESLRPGVSRRRLRAQRIPSHIRVINHVAVPMSGDITRRARLGYRVLLRSGPNDGLTLLADAVALGGCTIMAVGEDHYLTGVPVEARTVALVRAILDPGAPACRSGRHT